MSKKTQKDGSNEDNVIYSAELNAQEDPSVVISISTRDGKIFNIVETFSKADAFLDSVGSRQFIKFMTVDRRLVLASKDDITNIVCTPLKDIQEQQEAQQSPQASEEDIEALGNMLSSKAK